MTQIKLKELKPCPFCGHKVYMRAVSSKRAFVFTHEGLWNCPFYQFEISWLATTTIREARELWNRRVTPQTESEGEADKESEERK